jgi:hypothetical protein
MPQTKHPLVEAIMQRERAYEAARDRMRDAVENDPEAWEATVEMREAIELCRCLCRLVPACSVTDIHRAFGAPGDFGYETLIGDALARLYRGEP